MVESIGPYKTIGWRRRFRLIDNKDEKSLAYEFLDIKNAYDCQQLRHKFEGIPLVSEYLNSLTYGLWVPLKCNDIELGYIILEWTGGLPDEEIIKITERFMDSIYLYVPLLFSACRSVITNNYLDDLWKAFGIILSAPTEARCYERIATACLELWDSDSTVYVGAPDLANQRIEIVTVKGRRALEAQIDESKHFVQLGKGIFSYALRQDRPVISFSIPDDDRFEYHSMRANGANQGSAIVAKLGYEPNEEPAAIISVEHELKDYFDDDDIRYLTGISHVGYQALSAHKNSSKQVSRDIDTLFTQMSHDVAEPLQALVADADVLRYQVSNIMHIKESNLLSNSLEEIANRSSNIAETGIELNKQVRKHLDAGIDGAATRVIEGRVNLYRLLNSLVDNWEDKAFSQNIAIKPFFDSFRSIEVQCDETELKSALGHLMGNALKYSFRGRRKGSVTKLGRHISIVGRISMGKASIEFQNYGVGILKSELSKVKEKYYRGYLAVKEGRAGTGRGLWSANNFFESVGGSIEIYSEYKGSDPSVEDGPYFTSVKAIMPYIASEEV